MSQAQHYLMFWLVGIALLGVWFFLFRLVVRPLADPYSSWQGASGRVASLDEREEGGVLLVWPIVSFFLDGKMITGRPKIRPVTPLQEGDKVEVRYDPDYPDHFVLAGNLPRPGGWWAFYLGAAVLLYGLYRIFQNIGG